MRILVTGHKGYIGSHLFEQLKSLGHDVAGIDLEGCTINGQDLTGEDICDGIPMQFYEFIPQFVFHLAAIPRVGYSIKNPVLMPFQNMLGKWKQLCTMNYMMLRQFH